MSSAAAIPGTENMHFPTGQNPFEHNSLQRVTDYPIVKSSLSTAYSVIASNNISLKLYETLESTSHKILDVVVPHLPVAQVDGYASKGLDYVEARFPAVKTETGEGLINRVRQPADQAGKVAREYANGVTSRLSPVTDQVAARIAQAQETLHGLQERLAAAVAAVPKDKASASEVINSIWSELESLSTYLATNVKELPAHAQAATAPLYEGFTEGVTHIKEELAKPDVPVKTKATNIINYTKDQVTPILASLSEMLTKKKAEAENARWYQSSRVIKAPELNLELKLSAGEGVGADPFSTPVALEFCARVSALTCDKLRKDSAIFSRSPIFQQAIVRAARVALRMASPDPRHYENDTHGFVIDIEYSDTNSDPLQSCHPTSFSRKSKAELWELFNDLCKRSESTPESSDLFGDGTANTWNKELKQGEKGFMSLQIYHNRSEGTMCVIPARSVVPWVEVKARMGRPFRFSNWELEACHSASPCFNRQTSIGSECPTFVALASLAEDTDRLKAVTPALSAFNAPIPNLNTTHALVLLLQHDPASKLKFRLVDAQIQPHSKAVAHMKASCMTLYEYFFDQYLECLDAPDAHGRVQYNIVLLEQHGLGGRFVHAKVVRLRALRTSGDRLAWKKNVFELFNGKGAKPPVLVSSRSLASVPPFHQFSDATLPRPESALDLIDPHASTGVFKFRQAVDQLAGLRDKEWRAGERRREKEKAGRVVVVRKDGDLVDDLVKRKWEGGEEAEEEERQRLRKKRTRVQQQLAHYRKLESLTTQVTQDTVEDHSLEDRDSAIRKALETLEQLLPIAVEEVERTTNGLVAAKQTNAAQYGRGNERLELNIPLHTTSNPTNASFRADLWLPDKWNKRLLGVGHRQLSLNSKPDYETMRKEGLQQGFATFSFDTTPAYPSAADDDSAAEPSESLSKLIDSLLSVSHVSLDHSTTVSKIVTKSFYGRWRKVWAYFVGCGEGGREGLVAAQRLPGVFDGIVVGAPVLEPWRAEAWRTRRAEQRLDEKTWALIHKEVLRQCDGIDGVLDGILEDPRNCHFRPETLTCKDGKTKNCLTKSQLSAVRKLYNNVYDDADATLFTRTEPGGELAYHQASRSPLMLEFNAAVSALEVDPLVGSPELEVALTGINANDVNLVPFAKKGGKLLSYFGWADNVVAPQDSVRREKQLNYYAGVYEHTKRYRKQSPENFYRVFPVPGMQHCAASFASIFPIQLQLTDICLVKLNSTTTTFGTPLSTTAKKSVPIRTSSATHELLQAVVHWAEKGRAPESIVAASWKSSGPKDILERTRKLCRSPMRAVYVAGDEKLESSFKRSFKADADAFGAGLDFCAQDEFTPFKDRPEQDTSNFTHSVKYRVALLHADRSVLRMGSPNIGDHQNNTHGLLVHLSYNESEKDASKAFEIQSISRESFEELTKGLDDVRSRSSQTPEDDPNPLHSWIQQDAAGMEMLICVSIFREAYYHLVIPSCFHLPLNGAGTDVPFTHSGNWEEEACHMASPCFDNDTLSCLDQCPKYLALEHLAGEEACRSVVLKTAYFAHNSVNPESNKSHSLVLLVDYDPSAKFKFNLIDAQFQPNLEAVAHLEASCLMAYTCSLDDCLDCMSPPDKEGRVRYNVFLVEQHRGRFRHAKVLGCGGYPVWKQEVGKPWKEELFELFNGKDMLPRKEVPESFYVSLVQKSWSQGFESAVAVVESDFTAQFNKKDFPGHKAYCRRPPDFKDPSELEELTRKLNSAL
ncbi:hypothetical protein P7C70_g5380, partial [Phenoliferia sp. Uapishka_3]